MSAASYKPKQCANPACGRTFAPTGPRAAYCSPACKRAMRPVAAIAAKQRRLNAPIAGAIATALESLHARVAPVDLSLPGLGQIVRNVVTAHRAKDRDQYREALTELAAWALAELARVRSSDDASPS